MSEAFRGEFYQKVDSKARVSVPAAFRRIIEAGDPEHPANSRPRFVAIYGGPQQHLICYTVAGMARIEARIARMKSGSPERRALERNMLTRSQVVEIDDDGRIVVTQKLRDKLELALEGGTEAAFAGALDKFQIWNRADYDLHAAEDDDFELPEGADMTALLPDEDDGAGV
ncbi:MAG: division/cell wall cluster transcriptional repressor MraZ [Paracoccaceae bacterium]